MLDKILQNKCVIDTSVLSNFVFTGGAHLLHALAQRPVYITPAVLDPLETLLPDLLSAVPRCEFLKPLHEAFTGSNDRYTSAAPFIQSFVLSIGMLWEPVELTKSELELARQYSLRSIWGKTTGVESRFKKRGLGSGEAEACAVAVTRGWTLLVDDQPAVELLRGLGHSVAVTRTCALLHYAVEKDHLSCADAMKLFNEGMVDKYGFNATRHQRAERLWLRCNPARCVWEAA